MAVELTDRIAISISRFSVMTRDKNPVALRWSCSTYTKQKTPGARGKLPWARSNKSQQWGDLLAQAGLQFFCNDKNNFSSISKICFWPHLQTVNLSTLRPRLFVAPVKTYTTVKKFRKFTQVSEKIGLKDFPLGQVVEKKSCHIWYMGARVIRARGSIMSIFKNSFPLCNVFVRFWWRH